MALLAAVVVLGVASRSFGAEVAPWQRRLRWLAFGALLVVALGALPGVRSVYQSITGVGPLRVLREPQRYLALYHVWLASSVATGIERLRHRESARRSPAPLLALAAALVLSIPGWWAADNRVTTGDYPPGWESVKAIVDEKPGTAVALPWARYLNLSFAGERRVFNPLPRYLGGDVLASGELGLAEPTEERIDARQATVGALVDAAEAGDEVADALAGLGVRWLVIVQEAGFARYDMLTGQVGYDTAYRDDDVVLLEVMSWRAPSRADGTLIELDEIVAPLHRANTIEPVLFPGDGRTGWVRGLPLITSGDGADARSQWVWYWPSLLVVLADLVVLVAIGGRGPFRRPEHF